MHYLFSKSTLLPAIGLALLLTACNSTGESSAATETEEPTETSAAAEIDSDTEFLILPGERVGRITADNATRDGITAAYGAENVKNEPIYIGEGFSWDGLLVFPGTPNELQIAWDPEAESSLPAIIRVEQTGTEWQTDQGITIGTTLAELIDINEAPLNFLGFDWDYGGAVSNYNDGNIDNNLYIRMYPEGQVDDSLLGDQEISTAETEVPAERIKVVRLETRF